MLRKPRVAATDTHCISLLERDGTITSKAGTIDRRI